MLCLDKNILLLKLRSLIDISNSGPVSEYVKWDIEDVVIIENPGEKKTFLLNNACT
jgi:hypothetical protein